MKPLTKRQICGRWESFGNCALTNSQTMPQNYKCLPSCGSKFSTCSIVSFVDHFGLKRQHKSKWFCHGLTNTNSASKTWPNCNTTNSQILGLPAMLRPRHLEWFPSQTPIVPHAAKRQGMPICPLFGCSASVLKTFLFFISLHDLMQFVVAKEKCGQFISWSRACSEASCRWNKLNVKRLKNDDLKRINP